MDEQQYLALARKVLLDGEVETGRNGPVRTVFGHTMRFSLRDGTLPLLTTKKLAWRTCFKELMWFVHGRTDTASLRAEGVHIWDGNATRAFLDSRGLTQNPEGDLGPIYGFQWRHFGAAYAGCDADYTGQGVDQLAELVSNLKNHTPESARRLVISAWNPAQNGAMALPPCHVLMQFRVSHGGDGAQRLSCALYQRSGDVALGVPFNIASYAMLTHILAAHCGMAAHELVYFLGDAHVYECHAAPLAEQIHREPLEPPRIRVWRTHERIEDYDLSDIEFIVPYSHHAAIPMQMVP
jgi:thymidylate synthase